MSVEKLLPQYQGTNLEALLEGLLSLRKDLVETPLKALLKEHNLQTAQGVFLDEIGYKVGLKRGFVEKSHVPWFGFEGNTVDLIDGFDRGVLFDPTLNTQSMYEYDDMFRMRIANKIIRNFSVLTLDNFIDSLYSIYLIKCRVTVLAPLVINLQFLGFLSSFSQYYLHRVIHLPVGVVLNQASDYAGIFYQREEPQEGKSL